MLVLLVLRFELVSLVGIQQTSIFSGLSDDYRLCFQKGFRRAATWLPLSEKTERFRSTNPVEDRESKCSCTQSQFWRQYL